MKQLTDSERLEVAMELFTTQQLERYRLNCIDLEHQPERNGFHNTPAECEGLECLECEAPDGTKRDVNCPYVD